MRTAEQDVGHALDRMRTLEGFEKVRFIILYGSVAEGRARAGSDIDLAVYYDGAGRRPPGSGLRRSPNSPTTATTSRSSPSCRSISGRRFSADGSSTAPTNGSSTTSPDATPSLSRDFGGVLRAPRYTGG